MTDDDPEKLSFLVNSKGPRPEDNLVTSYVSGLDRMRVRHRRSLITTIAITAIAVFSLALVLGSVHVPIWQAFANGLMVVGAVTSGILTGLNWGEYRLLLKLSTAPISVQVYDRENETDDEEE